MDPGIEPSSHNESLTLGLLLLGFVFFTFINPKMFRPMLFILLVACLTHLPTVAAGDRIVHRMRPSVPLMAQQARKQQPTRLIDSGLHPATEKAVYFILMLYGFVILNLVICGVGIFLDLLVPFLPLAYALGGFSTGHNELDSMAVEPSVVFARFWIMFLPTVVFIYSGFRKSRYTQEYMVLDILSISLGYIQQVVESYQRQQVSWASFAIKGLLVGHFLISVAHLIYTFNNPIHKFQAIIKSYIRSSAAFQRTNRQIRRTLDRQSKKGLIQRSRQQAVRRKTR